MEVIFGEYLISTDKSKLDVGTISKFLARSYWAHTRPVDRIVRSIEHSLCFGVYHGDRQVAFARAVTDWSTMYWLADVFVDEEYRGRGLGKKLIETVVSCEALEGLNGILGTVDAHGLYEQYGFVRNPERAMVRRP